jgi:EAL domain-containing protein (putative c-di-GMP-specific phosphodiesterase class I)
LAVDVLALFPEALKNEEFLVYYQPKVSLRNYRLAGAEALVRWKHGDNFIFPDQFIPTLEKDGAICDLDFYMLDHVCADLRRWLDQGHRLFKVSVNLSSRSAKATIKYKMYDN